MTDTNMIQNYAPEKYVFIYMSIVLCLTKTINHAKSRRNNIINKKDFKDLIDEITSTFRSLENHISITKKNISKENDLHYISCIIYHYMLLFTAKLILFNIELSPYIYSHKISRSKKYVQVKCKPLSARNIIINDYNYNNDNDNKKETSPLTKMLPKNTSITAPKSLTSLSSSILINESNDNNEFITSNNNEYYTQDDIVSQLEIDNYKSCTFINYPVPFFNYREYNENEENNVNNSLKFLEIPPFLNDFDYENSFNVCLDTVDKATKIIRKLIAYFDEAQLQIKYQNCLCWTFYNIGLFYMLVYANFRNDDVKENIEFYHKQIKVMYKVFPVLSLHFSKLYEKAKNEAYEAYSNDTIIFYPRGPF